LVASALLAAGLPPRPNGTFALARILAEGTTLELMTDAFGVGGLYYREWQDVVLFASNPRFLAMDDDVPDLGCWLMLLSYGCTFGERHLTRDIRRAPPGSVLSFTGSRREVRSWFSFESLPEPTEPIDDHALQRVEAAFRQSLQRCRSLPHRETMLPLTSGHDSRRILAELLEMGEHHRTLTVRVLQKDNRDLDARFAEQLAACTGVDHQTIELPPSDRYAETDRLRRALLDCESPWHLWALPMAAHMPKETSLVLDGLGGDVLGETGFEAPEMFISPDRGTNAIAELLVDNAFVPVLDWTVWPRVETLRAEVRDWLLTLPAHQRPDLAFLLSRTARSAALWSQRLVPSGHIAVYPYLDLDYVVEAMRLAPLERIERSLQDRCLQRFQPAHHAIPGSRNIPHWLPPGASGIGDACDLACIRSMAHHLKRAGAEQDVRRLLSPSYRARSRLAALSAWMTLRARWWLGPLLALVYRQQFTPPVWQPETTIRRWTRGR
jgi:hypothetical protein